MKPIRMCTHQICGDLRRAVVGLKSGMRGSNIAPRELSGSLRRSRRLLRAEADGVPPSGYITSADGYGVPPSGYIITSGSPMWGIAA